MSQSKPFSVGPLRRCGLLDPDHVLSEPVVHTMIERYPDGPMYMYVGVRQCLRCRVVVIVLDHVSGTAESMWQVRP